MSGPGWLAALRTRLAGALFRSRLYGLSLGTAAPQTLALVPADPWPGNPSHGSAILDGRFDLAGQHLSMGTNPWAPAGATEDALAELHGFDWLRDLRSLNGDAARRQVRNLVAEWIEQHDRAWHPLIWRPDVLGLRLSNWLIAHDFFCASADDGFRRMVFASLARQHRHLVRTMPGRLDGVPMLLALKGAIFGALCLTEARDRARLSAALTLLKRELGRQVLGDGGHCQRSPALHLAALRHLIDIRTLLRAAQGTPGVAIDDIDIAPVQTAVERMVMLLRSLRHGDGGLALFNGSQEGDPVLIDTVLTLVDGRSRPLRSARFSGFERLLSGRLLVLMDTGRPPPPGLDRSAHAGTLSLEVSFGRERVIVNCGAHHAASGVEADISGPPLDDMVAEALAWDTALRGTAAHSTLMLGEQDSARPLDGGGLAGRPRRVVVEREEADGAILITASHDGYAGRFGFLHQRRLYLGAGGDDMRVEDQLIPVGQDGPATGAAPAAGLPFAIRLHLHPAVTALPTQDGTAILLRLSGRTGFRFRAGGAWLALEDSLYLGQPDSRRRTQQIVLTGTTTAEGALVKWALKRERKG